jgi:hypothetical protein
MSEQPLIDFSSGYVRRALAMLPKQGTGKPWKLYQNYALDLLTLRLGSLTDCMDFSRRNGSPPSIAESLPADGAPVPSPLMGEG